MSFVKKVLSKEEIAEYKHAKVAQRRSHQHSGGKFNFTPGAGTPKGDIHKVRLITKDHTDYSKCFDELGNRKLIEVKEVDKNE